MSHGLCRHATRNVRAHVTHRERIERQTSNAPAADLHRVAEDVAHRGVILCGHGEPLHRLTPCAVELIAVLGREGALIGDRPSTDESVAHDILLSRVELDT